ncbi:MAG: hypothetical protein RIE73_11655 [Coleofasciculus sp. C1-SOL-03]
MRNYCKKAYSLFPLPTTRLIQQPLNKVNYVKFHENIGALSTISLASAKGDR